MPAKDLFHDVVKSALIKDGLDNNARSVGFRFWFYRKKNSNLTD